MIDKILILVIGVILVLIGYFLGRIERVDKEAEEVKRYCEEYKKLVSDAISAHWYLIDKRMFDNAQEETEKETEDEDGTD